MFYGGAWHEWVHAGLWWVMSGINQLSGIYWTCLSECVDEGPRESVFSPHKLLRPNQGQGPPYLAEEQKRRQMYAYTLKDKQR